MSQCNRCEGSGKLWADGKAHHHSDTRPTINCPQCGGSGKDLEAEIESLRTQLAEEKKRADALAEDLRVAAQSSNSLTKQADEFAEIAGRLREAAEYARQDRTSKIETREILHKVLSDSTPIAKWIDGIRAVVWEEVKTLCKSPADLTQKDSDIGYRDALDSIWIQADKKAAALRVKEDVDR